MAVDTLKLVEKDNIVDIDNCITRVRLTVKSNEGIEQNNAQEIGYTGVFKPGKSAIQFVIGPESEIIANNMKTIISNYEEYKTLFEEPQIPNDEIIENLRDIENDEKEIIKRIIDDEEFFDKTTIKKIKEILNAHGIDYKSNSKKIELKEKLKEIILDEN